MKTDALRNFRHALRQLETEIGLGLSGQTACCGVTVAQCHLLLETERCGGACLGDLADSLATDKSALSRTVESLVRDGLVERAQNPENRRKVSIRLTGAGAEKAESINLICDESHERVFSLIPADKHDQVVESVVLLASAMRRSRKEASCPC